MDNLIEQITFQTSNNPPYAAGDVLQIYWDDVALALKITKNGSVITSGADLTTFPNSNIGTVEYTIIQTGFGYCSGNNFIYWFFTGKFPYVTQGSETNSLKCYVPTGNTCDIAFVGLPVLSKPSDDQTADGSITVSATSSKGTIKYDLQNVDYTLMTNTSGIFSSLAIGDYTIYAKDPNGCTAIVSITLTAVFDYGVYYRINFSNLAETACRIDILKKGYSGSITTLDTVDLVPIKPRMNGENSEKFSVLFPTEADVNLMSTSGFEFSIFFTDYERTYIVKYYKNTGSGLTEIWRGANMPGLYQEPFVMDPYPVSITFTDQLALLSGYKFLDDNKNNYTNKQKLITVIATILSKTGLELPIRCGVNIFDIGMSTGVTDDPFNQAYVDCDCFYDVDLTNPKMCDFVLSEILKPFGARIVQSYGYWWIVAMDEMTSSFNYREFDKNGNYITHGTFNEIVASSNATDTNRIVWKDQDPTLEVIRSFGRLVITQTTDPKESIIPNYGFEKPFDPNYLTGIPFWSYVDNGQATKSYITKPGNGDDSRKQITVDVSPNLKITTEQDITIKIPSSQAITIAPTNINTNTPSTVSNYLNGYLLGGNIHDFVIDPLDGFEFSVDYYVNFNKGYGGQKPSWMGFRLSVQCGDWFLQDESAGVTDDTISSIELLRTYTTVGLTVNGFISFTDVLSGKVVTYKIVSGTDADNSPLVVRPNDYNSSTNAKVWKLQTWGGWKYDPGRPFGSNWIECWEQNVDQGWKTKKFQGDMPPVADSSADLNVCIMPYWYYALPSTTPSVLSAISTLSKNPGFIFIGNGISSSVSLPTVGLSIDIYSDVYWKLKIATPGEDFIDINLIGHITVPADDVIVPDDYNQYSNNVIWKKQETIATKIRSSVYQFNRNIFYAEGGINTFDNVKFKCKPKATDPSVIYHRGNITTDPPKDQNFILNNDLNIKNELNVTIFLGDTSQLINNSKYIYRNFFSLSDGTPTSKWTRTGLNEAKSLGELLVSKYLQQYSNPTWKLSGTFHTRYFSNGSYHEKFMSFLSTITQNSRFMIPTYMEFNERECDVRVEMLEIKSKSFDTGTGAGAFDQTQFNNNFDI